MSHPLTKARNSFHCIHFILWLDGSDSHYFPRGAVTCVDGGFSGSYRHVGGVGHQRCSLHDALRLPVHLHGQLLARQQCQSSYKLLFYPQCKKEVNQHLHPPRGSLSVLLTSRFLSLHSLRRWWHRCWSTWTGTGRWQSYHNQRLRGWLSFLPAHTLAMRRGKNKSQKACSMRELLIKQNVFICNE